MAQTALAPQLQAILESFAEKAPDEIKKPVAESHANLHAIFDKQKPIQPGASLPPFELSDAVGKTVSSADLLAKGPILVSFYRGSWCPFCSLELRALQQHVDQFHAKGVTLVAISPELPDTSLSTVEKNELRFPVLSDVHNEYARRLGLVWKMPDALRPAFAKLGHDLASSNGDDSFEVPVPATLLVDRKGTVRNAFVEPDYRKRLEPSAALDWIDSL